LTVTTVCLAIALAALLFDMFNIFDRHYAGDSGVMCLCRCTCIVL